MKKFIIGQELFLMGVIFNMLLYLNTNALYGRKKVATLLLFMSIVGLVICIIEAYAKKSNKDKKDK